MAFTKLKSILDSLRAFFVRLDERLVLGFLLLTGPAFALLPVSPWVMSFSSRDSGVFLYIGWRILNGEVPYLHIWDHKPPLIFFVDALGLWLAPNSLWGIWLLEWLFLAGAVWAAYQLMQPFFGRLAALLGLLVFLFSFTLTLAGGNLTTEYTIPLQFAILLLFARAKKGRFFLIGFAAALAFLFRQNAIGIPLAVGLFLFLETLRSHQWKALFWQYAQMLAGAMVPLGLVILYFALVPQGLAAFWDAAFVYNFFYADERGWPERIYAAQYGFLWLRQTGLSQLALAGWLAAFFWLLSKPVEATPALKRFLWLTILALPIEILLVSISGRPRIPYYLTLLPVFSVFAAFLGWRALVVAAGKFPVAWVAATASTGLLVYALFLLPGYVATARGFHQILDSHQAVAYLQAHTNPNDSVLMWGAETAINFYARRRSPTRFVYQYPLQKNEYAGSALYEEFLTDILTNQPRFIIVTTSNKIPRSFGRESTLSEQLIAEVRRLYVKKERLGEWVVFERIP